MKLLILCSLILAGCSANRGHEIHIFADFETGDVTGYVVIDGVKHTLILDQIEK
jgi:hypothetical protein